MPGVFSSAVVTTFTPSLPHAVFFPFTDCTRFTGADDYTHTPRLPSLSLDLNAGYCRSTLLHLVREKLTFYAGVMSYVKGKGLGQEEARVHRIRITLTSKNVKNLEKGELQHDGKNPSVSPVLSSTHVQRLAALGSNYVVRFKTRFQILLEQGGITVLFLTDGHHPSVLTL